MGGGLTGLSGSGSLGFSTTFSSFFFWDASSFASFFGSGGFFFGPSFFPG